jgi:CubicO group peptidase (beta-lactamase class C family)
VTLDEAAIERLIVAAGYDPATPVAVGVGSPATAVCAAQGASHGATRFDCDSVAYGGSLAKQVTGACAALLVRRGTLDVEAPIAEWLPELPAWAQAIRVRHLVHHVAALPTTEAVWARMTSAGETDWTSEGVLAALSTWDALEGRPGAAYAYSNAGYVCLACVVERLSGRDLDAFAQEHLFEPLGLSATRLWAGPALAPPGAAPVQPPGEPAPLSVGDGGLWTTVRDLLRWNEALLEDTLGIATKLHTTGELDDGTPLDYAWGVRVYVLDGEPVQSHGGSWDGATAKLVRLPARRLGFAALAHDGSVERMTALSALLQDALLG